MSGAHRSGEESSAQNRTCPQKKLKIFAFGRVPRLTLDVVTPRVGGAPGSPMNQAASFLSELCERLACPFVQVD